MKNLERAVTWLALATTTTLVLTDQGPEVPNLPVVSAFSYAVNDSTPWRMIVARGDTIAPSAGKTFYDPGYDREFVFAYWPLDADLKFWPKPTHYAEVWTGGLIPPPEAERDYWFATDPQHPNVYGAEFEVRIYEVADPEPHDLLEWYTLIPDSTCADLGCVDVVAQPDPEPDPEGPRLTLAYFAADWVVRFAFEDSAGSRTSALDPATVEAADFVLTHDGVPVAMGEPSWHWDWYFNSGATKAAGEWQLKVLAGAVADTNRVYNAVADSIRWVEP